MALSLYDCLDHWSAQPASTRLWSLTFLALSLAGLLWNALRKLPGVRGGKAKLGVRPDGSGVCPPEQLQDDLKALKTYESGVVNGYAMEREMDVPFEVGDVRVSKILVHPIKSCRGTSVQEARYTPEGLENDRRWCIIEADTHTIITAREFPRMVLISPRIEKDPASPHGGRLIVSFPAESGCEEFSVPLEPTPEVTATWPVVDDCMMFKVHRVQGLVCASLDPGSSTPSAILSAYFGRPVHLAMKGPKVRECPTTQAFPDLKASAVFQDGFPFLVASEESLEEVGRVVSAYASDDSPENRIGGIDREKWKGGKVTIERFRPNIVVKGSGVPFGEDMWRQIVVCPEDLNDSTDESRTFTLVSKCTRCLLPNVDPTTGQRDAAVPYKVLLKFRRNKDPARMSKPCFGCNAVVGGEGVVRVGDKIEVKEWASGIGV